MADTLGDLTNVDMKVYPTNECKSNCHFCMTDLRWKNTEAPTEKYLSNFKKAFEDYFNAGGRKVLFTGGEPTNRPDKLIGMLKLISNYPLDLVVIYTSGVNLLTPYTHNSQEVTLLQALSGEGLKDYNLSVHHYELHKRQELTSQKVCDLESIVEEAKELDLNIRLNCTLMKDYIGNAQEVMKYVDYARSLGVQDIYFRDLFHLANRDRSCAHANKAKLAFTDSQRVDFDTLVSEIKLIPNMQFNETLNRHRENGRTYIFDHLGTRISFGTLVVGTEKEDEITYMNFQPDGCAYRDMNGPESKLDL
ncbi:MAG: radical SAM protein [Nanoarchaeota archaeon]|nr:radical SAM protein [Nanoarchaeota archaeon]MBU1632262.1 radical SAM protein [Nanoarchaeota archaeon]MBU1876031.1 radical SAM protein [Nanoarchaeota archaeon]